jgi:hypothetical protein
MITSKEKAYNLIGKFMMFDTHDEDPFIIRQHRAKRYASIAVDEIILSNPHSNPFNTDVYSTMEYWQEVKQEIEKL